MNETEATTVAVSRTELQGMMQAGYTEQSVICLGDYRLVCIDGTIWELREQYGEVLLTVNPTVVATDAALRELLAEALE